MTMAVTVRETTMPQMKYSVEDVNALKETFFKGMSDSQARLAVRQAERQSVDLFSGEAVTFSTQGRTVLFVTIQGLRARAARSGRYLPGKPTVYQEPAGAKHPDLATASIQIFDERTSSWIEVCDSADWREYGSNRGAWQTHPWSMLAKCAEAKALRRAFPVEMSGLYIPEEREAEEVPKSPAYSCESCGSEMSPTDASIAKKAFTKQVCAPCRAAKAPPAPVVQAQQPTLDGPPAPPPPADPLPAQEPAPEAPPAQEPLAAPAAPVEMLQALIVSRKCNRARLMLASHRVGCQETAAMLILPNVSPLGAENCRKILEVLS